MIGSLCSFRRLTPRRANDLSLVLAAALSVGLVFGSSGPAAAQAKPAATIPVATPGPRISMPGSVGVTSQIVDSDTLGLVLPPPSGSVTSTNPPSSLAPANSPGVIVTLITPALTPETTTPETAKPSKKTSGKRKRTTKASSAETEESSSTVKAVIPAEPVGTEVPAAKTTPSQESILAALRKCESGGNYKTNTGNGYYGAYQFALGTWRKLGYSGYPHEASPATQDEAVLKLAAKAGWGQWPACSRKMGLR
jgi:Transglycosylase-like domain